MSSVDRVGTWNPPEVWVQGRRHGPTVRSGHSISLRAEAAKLAPEVRWSHGGGWGGGRMQASEGRTPKELLRLPWATPSWLRAPVGSTQMGAGVLIYQRRVVTIGPAHQAVQRKRVSI